MRFLGLFVVLCICWTSTSLRIPQGSIKTRDGIDVELISNGTTYKFTNGYEYDTKGESVITVLENGDVITDIWTGRPEQKWTLVEHPKDPLCLEFINFAVPYNELSGFEDLPENPGVYPRPLTLNKNRIMPDSLDYDDGHIPVFWQILIRNRWCLQANGRGNRLDMDDCEWSHAPHQLWALRIVELNPSQS